MAEGRTTEGKGTAANQVEENRARDGVDALVGYKQWERGNAGLRDKEMHDGALG